MRKMEVVVLDNIKITNFYNSYLNAKNNVDNDAKLTLVYKSILQLNKYNKRKKVEEATTTMQNYNTYKANSTDIFQLSDFINLTLNKLNSILSELKRYRSDEEDSARRLVAAAAAASAARYSSSSSSDYGSSYSSSSSGSSFGGFGGGSSSGGGASSSW